MDCIIIAFICLMIKLCTTESTKTLIDKSDANPYNTVKSDRWLKNHPNNK